METPDSTTRVPQPQQRSLSDLVSGVRSTAVVASPLPRYLTAALIGAGTALLALLAPAHLRSSLLLVCYPVVGGVAGLAGVGAGVAASAGAALLALAPGTANGPALRLAEDALFWITLALVALLVGRLAHSLRTERTRARQEQLAASEFSAALHLRLMLAEQEIERLRGGSPRDPAAGPGQPG